MEKKIEFWDPGTPVQHIEGAFDFLVINILLWTFVSPVSKLIKCHRFSIMFLIIPIVVIKQIVKVHGPLVALSVWYYIFNLNI